MQTLDDAQFKKMIENLQPQSSHTHKLCQRLGYNIKDLKYKQLNDFQAITPELQRIKYEHYKARTMRIIQDIIEVRHRHKHQTQMQSKISFTFLPETRNMTTKVELSEFSSSFTDEPPDIDGDQRLKITQRLIGDELKRKKKYAEYMAQQTQKGNKLIHKDLSNIQRRIVTEQSKQHIPRTDDQNYTNRLQYLTLEEEASFRASTMKSKSLKTKSKLFKNESIENKKMEQQKDFEEFQKKTLQDLEKKEQEVKKKIKLFRNGTVTQLQAKSRQNAEILQRKEILTEEQMNEYLLKQCQKLQNITQRKEQLKQIENKDKMQKQLFKLQQQQKFQKNLENQQHYIEMKNMQQQEQMEQKMEKVQFDKQRYLKSKSESIKELKQIKLEDVQFNRYHNKQLQLQYSGKIFEKTEYAIEKKQKSQIKFELNRTQALFQHQKQVEKEVQLWKQVKKATQLFDDPMEYERYKLDLKAVMLKQKPSLETKFIYLTNLIKQILPKSEAETILMPEGLIKEIEIEKNKIKKPR